MKYISCDIFMKHFIIFATFMSSPFFAISADKINLGKNFYIGIGAGALSPNDVDGKTSASASYGGYTFTANGEFTLKFDTGRQISGLIGYRLTDWLGIEAEMSHTSFDYDKADVSAAFSITSGGTTTNYGANTSINIDGNVSAFSMVFGPVVDYDLSSSLEIFAWGWDRFSSYSEEINSLNGDTSFASDVDNTEFASKIKTGFNYFITDYAHIQFEYGYNYVNSSNDVFDDFDAHSYTGKAVFNF